MLYGGVLRSGGLHLGGSAKIVYSVKKVMHGIRNKL